MPASTPPRVTMMSSYACNRLRDMARRAASSTGVDSSTTSGRVSMTADTGRLKYSATPYCADNWRLRW